MRREWKPGDVAVAKYPVWGGSGKDTLYEDLRVVRFDEGWARADDPDDFVRDDNRTQHLEPRPLVVIDPEDRAQVERLLKSYCDEWGTEPYRPDGKHQRATECFQAALRSLLAPPIPEEPGVWSVAVVDDNVPFMRVAQAHITPPVEERWFGEHPKTGERVRLTWAELHALGDVRVANDSGITS